jgi:hypothetical protein
MHAKATMHVLLGFKSLGCPARKLAAVGTIWEVDDEVFEKEREQGCTDPREQEVQTHHSKAGVKSRGSRHGSYPQIQRMFSFHFARFPKRFSISMAMRSLHRANNHATRSSRADR